MKMDRFTEKSRELFISAQDQAKTAGHQELTVFHLLKAMLTDEERDRFEQFRKDEGRGREGKAGFGTLGDLLGKVAVKAPKKR